MINPVDAGKCLLNEAQFILTELDSFIALTNDAIRTSEKIATKAIEDLGSCAEDINQVMVAGQKSIIEEFEKCVGTNEYLRSKSSRNLEGEIIDLSNQPESDILKLHEYLSTIDSKIAEVLKNVDIDKFEDDVINKVKNILDKKGITEEDAKACILPEQDDIQMLISVISQRTKVCLLPIDDTVRDLKDGVLHLAEEAKQISKDIKSKVKACNNGLNVEDCLGNLLVEAQLNVKIYTSKIDESFAEFETVASQAVFDFLRCIIATQFDMYDEERRIIKEFKTCASNL